MPNGNRSVLGIVLQKGLLDLFNMSCAEVQAEAGSKRCQPLQLLPLRHTGATTSSTQHDGLNHAWNGELPLKGGSGCLISAHPGHHLHRDAFIVEGADLLVDGAVEGCIAIVEPNNTKAGPVPLDEEWKHFFQCEVTGLDPFTSVWNEFSDCWADQ
jgi:hypothetical protein